jgi:hypothetical protein
MLLPANSSTPTVLKAGGNGAVLDPFVTYDAAHVYYSYCPDMRPTALNPQRYSLPHQGCNIRKYTFATGADIEVVGQSFWRPSGLVPWSTVPDISIPAGKNYLGYGVMHMSPVPLPNGDLLFVSNANGQDIVSGYMHPNPQMFLLHADTNDFEQIWYPPTAILHPIPLSSTGEVSFATLENAFGMGKPQRWGIWSMLPNGTSWRPIYSATMNAAHTMHFHTECAQHIVTTIYYFGHNWGLGTLLSAPLIPPSSPAFGSAIVANNPAIQTGVNSFKFAYTPAGMTTPTPMFEPYDNDSDFINGAFVGKVGFPWCAPNDTLLLSYSGGPVNHHYNPPSQPMADLGIYTMPASGITAVSQLSLVINDSAKNEWMARPVVNYAAIYQVAAPLAQPTYPVNNGTVHSALPIGTPFGLIGTSSVYNRESKPGQWPPTWDSAYPVYNIDTNIISNRSWQGGDTYAFSNSEIYAIRILVQEPVAHLSYGPQASGYAYTRTFDADHGNERLSVLGDIPVRHFNGSGQPILDAQGNPDTSFLAKVPADTAFTFQLIDQSGKVLTHAPTWHQLRPGEMRVDCGGCHAHNSTPLAFSTTVAGQPGYIPTDLSTIAQPTKVEFHADIEPLLAQKCMNCHNPVTNAGQLDLQTTTLVGSPPAPRNYLALAKDQNRLYAGPPQIYPYVGRASRYIAPFSAGESLLAWAFSKARLDNIANSLRPTETIPGDVNSLQPPGTRQVADIDYSAAMHAAHAAAFTVTSAELAKLYQWIDTGMPRDVVATRGWKADELRPIIGWGDTGQTLYVGVHDLGSGFVPIMGDTLIVTRNGIPQQPGPIVSDGRIVFQRAPGLWYVRAKDQAGNVQTLSRMVQ